MFHAQHLMTSLQLLVLFLSVNWQMEAVIYNDYDDVELFDGLYRKEESNDACVGQKEIANWINDQVIKNSQLTSFNQQLGKLLYAINTKRPEEIGDEHCCFYEKNTMDKIMADVTALSAGSAVSTPLVASGDIGKDLDKILERMKLFVDKESKSCCDLITDQLNELKAETTKELDAIKLNIKSKKIEDSGAKDKLKAQQSELEIKLRDLTLRIDALERMQKEDREAAAKCCKDLNERIDVLKLQLEQAQLATDARAKQLEQQLKELTNKQGAHQKAIQDLQKDTEQRVAIINDTLALCEMGCDIKPGGSTGNTTNSAEAELKERLAKLEHLVVELADQLAQLHSLSESLAQCRKFKDTIEEMNALIQKLQAQLDANVAAQPDPKACAPNPELQEEIEKAKNCCRNAENLSTNLATLQLNVAQMGHNYNSHILKLEAQIKDLQERLDTAIEKQKEMSTMTTPKPEVVIDPEIAERIKRMQAELDTVSKYVVIIQKKLDDNAEKLSEHRDLLEKKIGELEDVLADRQLAGEAFEKDVEKRLKSLEALIIEATNKPKPDDNLAERLASMEKEFESLRKDTDRILNQQERISELEKHVQQLLERLAANEDRMKECTDKCDSFDKLDDLIDRIEDMEKVAGITSAVDDSLRRTPAKSTTKRGPWMKAKSTTKIVGFIGSVDKPIPINRGYKKY